VFEPALQEIEADPIPPLPPEVITSHGAVRVTLQAQSLSVDTLIEPLPPPDPMDAPPGLML
jgi:hypothetical protein